MTEIYVCEHIDPVIVCPDVCLTTVTLDWARDGGRRGGVQSEELIILNIILYHIILYYTASQLHGGGGRCGPAASPHLTIGLAFWHLTIGQMAGQTAGQKGTGQHSSPPGIQRAV